jgi:hypothetical protein
MQAARSTKLFLLLALAVSPVQAQTDPDAIRSSLEEIFSIATFGAITIQDQAAEVTRSGANYQVRLPLSGFSAPADAAINVVAHPVEHGLLDVTSVTYPSVGTVETSFAGGPATRITYSIGQQAITAKIDPSLAVPSSYAADFKKVRLASEHGEQHAEQTFDHYSGGGTFSVDPGGLLTLASQGSGTGVRYIGHGPNGLTWDVMTRAIAGHFAVEGLDRAQATRLLTAVRGIAASDTIPEPPAGASPEQSGALRAIVEAANGLLNRIEAEEVVEDVRFAAGAGANANGGSVDRLRLNVLGDTLDERLNTRVGIALDGISSSALSAENAVFIPHHVDIKTAVAGVPIGTLKALLRAATEADMDPATIEAQAMGLLADPQIRIGVEAFSFDSGPLQVRGSARVVPGANGQVGGEIHVSASGMAELLAQVQNQPNLQGILPMVFMAKGMGRPRGDSLVWDISMGNGKLTVNGLPFGQPADKTR